MVQLVQLSSPEKVENLVPDQSNPSGEPDKVNVDVEETDAIEILRCPEIWDPYRALALYMFIQRRRAIEAPARSSMSTPTATEILDDDEEEPQAAWGLQKAGQPGPSRPRVRERCRVSNSKFTLEIIEARTLQAYSNSLPAAEIPIPGKLSSRLLDIGWITKAEAQANFLPTDWEALEWYNNRERDPIRT
ncbi:hypothetical protein BDP27DRAFT_1405061 [Rhodocollybia butyracea]|uniref:Uncharacterized protein n=1 Tax=Rhodocollybia butyracea TaxID=206335 RepID=A0A9P5PN35_9AGAR|nr:hypothetical protein BDP27DRAFT_1405061 [Rhodocollybia butyracea]